MSNAYYTAAPLLPPHEQARAEAVNAHLLSIETGFDKLLSPTAFSQRQGAWATATGDGNPYALTFLSNPPTAYGEGLHLEFEVPATNLGAVTLDLHALGVKALVHNASGVQLAAGDLPVGAVVTTVYDGVQFRLVNLVTTTGASGDPGSSFAEITGSPYDNAALGTALNGKSDTAHTHPNATTVVAGFESPADKTKIDALELQGPPGILKLSEAAFDGSGNVAWSTTWPLFVEITGPITKNLTIAMPPGTFTGRTTWIKRSQTAVGPWRVTVTGLDAGAAGQTSLSQPAMWVSIGWDATDKWQRRLFENVPRAATQPGITDLTSANFVGGVYTFAPATDYEHIRVTSLTQNSQIVFNRLAADCFIDQQVYVFRADGSAFTLTLTGLGTGGSSSLAMPNSGQGGKLVYRSSRIWEIVGAVTSSSAVPETRQILAGAGLSGGGTLAADVTLSAAFGGSGAAETVSRSDHTHTGLLPAVGTEGQVLGVVAGAWAPKTDNRGEGAFISRADTASPIAGEPPAPVPLILSPATDTAGGYIFTEALTANLDIQLSVTGQRQGHRLAIHRSGANGAFLFTIVGLLGDTDSNLAQYETALVEFDGALWVFLGKLGPMAGGTGSFIQTVALITESGSLTVGNQMYGVSGGNVVHKTLLVKPAVGSTAIVLTVPNDAPVGLWYIERDETHTGSLTIVNQSAASTLNGTAGGSVTVATAPRATVVVQVKAQAGAAATATAKGDTSEDVTIFGLLKVGSVIGTPLSGISGALTVAAHNGRMLAINGNVTMPLDVGFTCVIRSTGNHTVQYGNGPTTALSNNEMIAVWVDGLGGWRSPIQTAQGM